MSHAPTNDPHGKDEADSPVSGKATVTTAPFWMWKVLIGLFILSLLAVWNRGCQEKSDAQDAARAARKAEAQKPVPPPEFPKSGEGPATQDAPLKAWMDPKKIRTMPSRPARYVFYEDRNVYFDDVGPNVNHKEWLTKPRGKYLVYPLPGIDRIYFQWEARR